MDGGWTEGIWTDGGSVNVHGDWTATLEGVSCEGGWTVVLEEVWTALLEGDGTELLEMRRIVPVASSKKGHKLSFKTQKLGRIITLPLFRFFIFLVPLFFWMVFRFSLPIRMSRNDCHKKWLLHKPYMYIVHLCIVSLLEEVVKFDLCAGPYLRRNHMFHQETQNPAVPHVTLCLHVHVVCCNVTLICSPRIPPSPTL